MGMRLDPHSEYNQKSMFLGKLANGVSDAGVCTLQPRKDRSQVIRKSKLRLLAN